MKRLRAARSFADFVADPVGSYWLSTRYLLFSTSHELLGVVAWGRAAEEDVLELLPLFDRPRASSLRTATDVLFDFRRLTDISHEAFVALLEGAQQRREEIAARVRRQAVVRWPGIVGAVVAGFGDQFRIDEERRLLPTLDEALQWLGQADASARARELDELVERAAFGSPTLARLEAWLSRNCANGSVDRAAASLGLSTRSLQRLLGEAGTSFRDQRRQACLTLAKHLLTETDEKLETIAKRIGYTTPGLVRLFERECATSPSGYRVASRRKR